MFWSNEHSRISASGEKSFTLYIFETLELRRAAYGEEHDDANAPDASDYEVSHYTLSPYLRAHGVRLARLVYEGSGAVPEEATGTGEGEVNGSTSELHVFFELGDHLGSTSVVLDKPTGELVERSTFEGYGSTESDYRPGRWKNFREDYKFTGKEEDVEVGLVYFGKRFLNTHLGRWISADPLAIHAPGQADLNVYAYVSGSVLKNVDPLGLEEEEATAARQKGMSAGAAGYVASKTVGKAAASAPALQANHANRELVGRMSSQQKNLQVIAAYSTAADAHCKVLAQMESEAEGDEEQLKTIRESDDYRFHAKAALDLIWKPMPTRSSDGIAVTSSEYHHSGQLVYGWTDAMYDADARAYTRANVTYSPLAFQSGKDLYATAFHENIHVEEFYQVRFATTDVDYKVGKKGVSASATSGEIRAYRATIDALKRLGWNGIDSFSSNEENLAERSEELRTHRPGTYEKVVVEENYSCPTSCIDKPPGFPF